MQILLQVQREKPTQTQIMMTNNIDKQRGKNESISSKIRNEIKVPTVSALNSI